MDSWGERITQEKYYENKYSGYRGLVMGKSLINIDEETATCEKMKENELSIINFINKGIERKKNS
jgi:hypothetical protein